MNERSESPPREAGDSAFARPGLLGALERGGRLRSRLPRAGRPRTPSTRPGARVGLRPTLCSPLTTAPKDAAAQCSATATHCCLSRALQHWAARSAECSVPANARRRRRVASHDAVVLMRAEPRALLSHALLGGGIARKTVNRAREVEPLLD